MHCLSLPSQNALSMVARDRFCIATTATKHYLLLVGMILLYENDIMTLYFVTGAGYYLSTMA